MAGHKQARLLELYTVGKTLGEGAFGVVSACKNKQTGEELAVKMVDKVETPVHEIQKEASMLQSLDHPNIVKCHGVFYERCFICIVMDKYSGGDVVEGLQAHLKDKGQINCHDVVHTAQQMGDSIRYLHQRSVVHRDIKGDNFLMDRKDVTDPKCKIALTDFGTATTIQKGERLKAQVGTKIFWSPEFYDKDYGPKVDVWAMGVIMYGLVSGRFPFKDEAAIRTKVVKVPKRVHPVCEEFICKMLEKPEKARLSSDDVMAHPWVAGSDSGKKKEAEAAKKEEEDHHEPKVLHEDAANVGIKERRQELIHRMNREAQGPAPAGSTRESKYEAVKFTVGDKIADKDVQGAKTSYEWWESKKIQDSALLDLCKVAKPIVAESGKGTDLKLFSQMLAEHNIDAKLFGKDDARTLGELASEVRIGTCRLMLDASEHKKLVRVVDVVVLRLKTADADKRIVIETEEKFPDGRKRETLRLPGTKKEPHENTRETAERILREMVGLSLKDVKFDMSKVSRFEEEQDSPSYPGVRTVYRKEMVDAQLLASKDKWNVADSRTGDTRYFELMSVREAEAKKVKLKPVTMEVSALVKAPIGLDKDKLEQELAALGVDISSYGREGIKAFSSELIKGEASLMQDPSTSQVVRVVDVVLLIVQNQFGETLVEAEHASNDGSVKRVDRLPGSKCRPDENQFLSARRILRKQLHIDENKVTMNREAKFVEEEKPSPSYPGLKTVYRKRLIWAKVEVKR